LVKKIFILSIAIFSFISCGEYENLELKSQLNKRADSLFRVQKDSIRKLSVSKCDTAYQEFYKIAVDSIKKIQLSKIEDLIKK